MNEVQTLAAKPWGRLYSVPKLNLGQAGGLLLVLIVLCGVMSIMTPNFATGLNATNLMRGAAVTIVLSVGMTLVLLTAGIDLSIGAILAAGGVVYFDLGMLGAPGPLALLGALGAGVVLGSFNGYLIGRVGMSFFVVTLGTASLYRGAVLLWTDNQTKDAYGDGFARSIGDSILVGIVPTPFVIAIAVLLIAAIALRYTIWGRSVYATGGNREAAEFSGIDTGWIIMSVYAVSGLCAALAGVMVIGRSTIVLPSAGMGIELQVAAAVLLGGAALSGGAGSVWGTLLGVVFLEVLRNVLNFAGVSSFWQLLLTGAILLCAVFLDRIREKRRSGSDF